MVCGHEGSRRVPGLVKGGEAVVTKNKQIVLGGWSHMACVGDGQACQLVQIAENTTTEFPRCITLGKNAVVMSC